LPGWTKENCINPQICSPRFELFDCSVWSNMRKNIFLIIPKLEYYNFLSYSVFASCLVALEMQYSVFQRKSLQQAMKLLVQYFVNDMPIL
jgi:hypothetical protein